MQNFQRRFNYLNHENLPLIIGLGVGQGSPDYFWDSNQRKDHLIVFQFTLSGSGNFKSGGQVFAQQTGDFFLTEVPSKSSYTGENWQFIYLELTPIMRQWVEQSSIVVKAASIEFQNKLFSMVDYLKNEEIDLYQNARIAFEFLLMIKAEVAKQMQSANPQAEKLRQYLDQHYQTDLSLDHLEIIFEESKYRLIKTFEAAYQDTPMAYLRKVRILKSLELLWGKQTIYQIAEAVGFSSSNYFSKVFKKEMGLSPTEYIASKQIKKAD